MRHAVQSVALLLGLAASANAQRIQLELRPKMGDTLRMRLDQVTAIGGARGGAAMKDVVTTMHMYSRAIVENSSAATTLILAITDSVDVSSTDQHGQSVAASTERQLRGRQMRLKLFADGTVAVPDEAVNVPKEVNDLVSVMPGSFPKDPVEVGETWTREMPIAPTTRLGVPIGGVARATFRLDSVSRGGDLAFVSMRGSLQQQPSSPPGALTNTLSGSVNGSIVLNRRRGWLSESDFVVQMRTTVTATGAAQMAPVQFRMKITQHMRVVDKR